MYRNLHSENGWTSIALILAHGVSQPLLKTTLRFQIQIVTQSGDESSAKTKFIKVSETCIFYIGTLGLIDWTSGSRRDKTWVLVLAGYTFSKVARHAFCLVAQPSWSVTLWGVSRDRWSARNTMQYVTNLKLVLKSLCVPAHNILDRKTSTKLTTFVELT